MVIVVAVAMAMARLVAVVFVVLLLAIGVPLTDVGTVVPTAVDVVLVRGCGRINFWGGSYDRGTGPLAAATFMHICMSDTHNVTLFSILYM